ncbi:MAG TPA: Ig-like domain repeat protein, partial [Tahibacter sp.]|nr:Ig-like domain repeat protein [Tahibacter sp.]
GGSVTYTITASNAGPSNATGATVADTFPASQTCTWTCVGAGGGTCTASGSGNIANTVNLPAGGSVTYTASCAISASATGSMSNTATVAAPAGVTDPTPGNNAATDTDTLTALADLTITKTHTGNFTQGQTGATYTITAGNIGGSPTSGTVTVTDTLPAGLTATAIGGVGWSCTLGTLTCTRSDALAAGSSYPAISLTVDVANNAPASVINTASVSGGGQTNTANDSASDATTITQLSDLTLAKTHVGSFTQGQTGAVYILQASNTGAGPTSGTVTVTDTLPAGMTATAISGAGWSCTLGTLTCTRSDALAAGSSYPAISLTVDVANNAPASVTNTAAVSGGGQINTANDNASDVTTIATAAYTIGGNVSGATSPATLTLSDTTNGTSQATSSSGAFTFTTPLPIGASWNVAVTTPPSGQACAVANGTGTNLSANVTNVQVTCAAVLVTITPATLAAGTYSLPYSQQLSAGSSDSLDHAPYTFTLASGSLPAGLTLGTDGLLSGAPTAVGSFPFTVQAAGSGGVSGTQAYTLVVNRKTTTVSVTATPNPTSQGVPVTLVATVASGAPTGTVSFSADGAILPCSPVTLVVGTTSSTAACTTTFTSAGAHLVTASYSGDVNFESSTSPILAVMVDVPAVPVPALDRWAMLLLCGLLSTFVFLRSRRT